MRSVLTARKDGIAPESSQFVSAASLRVRLRWFNQLRWGAGLGVVAAVLIARFWLKLPLPMLPLLITGGGLLLLNAAYVWRNNHLAPTDLAAEIRLVKLQMLGDLVLTVLLNLSGGIENPLLLLYVVHVILASLLLRGRDVYQIAWLAILLFTGEVVAEYLGVLPHHHLLSASEMTHEAPFILMTMGSFWLVILLASYIGATFMKHARGIKDELVERQLALIEADRAKMDFFRFVTHEIKSPINTAQSALETALELGSRELSNPVADMLARAVSRLEQATEIVMNLADLTRGGDMRQEVRQPVDLGEQIARIAAHMEDLARRRRITIAIEVPPQPTTLVTSGAMTEKIIANLVSNAIRYNREGGRVTVRLNDLDTGILIEVHDEGIGIDPKDRDRIFEEFYRTSAAQRISHLGTGLGLPIVKRFVTQLGGTIAVRSEVGVGSTFTVQLPRIPAATPGRTEATT